MIPITRPYVGDEEALAAAEVVRSGWLSQGARVRKFEELVAAYVGARFAVATSNCTTALHLSLIAAGMGAGDEVICPSFSFIATANAILHTGATPVFVEIDPRTYNMDPACIEASITPRTRAIMPVDQIGLAADLSAIHAIARKYGLKVIEDAAPSLGATMGEARVGSISELTCFSFHPRKSITTGEGGVITTDSEEAAALLRRLRSHGASTSDLSRHLASSIEFEEYRELGYNCRMTDVQAAIGVVQMGKLPFILSARRRLALRYSSLLEEIDGVQAPFEPEGRLHTFQSYCVRLDPSQQREVIMARLAERGIATRRGVMAIHLEPLYRRLFPQVCLPRTERAAAETLLLPLYAGMTDGEQDLVVSSLRDALAFAA